MIKSKKMLFPLVLIIQIFLTGCGSQDVSAMSGNNVPDAEELFVEEETPVDEGTLQETGEAESSANEVTEPIQEREPVKVKGIYVTGPTAGTEKMDELIRLVEETELNAMVIDVKNDEGLVTYKMQSDTVLEIESGVRYIPDMAALIEKLHEKDIYLIARIVAFKDPYLAEKKPELSLKTKTGAVFRDKNGEAWVNPYSHEVWDYLVEIGKQAAEDGFDEIQFDYIRFSTDANAGSIDYGEVAEQMTKEEAITGFTKYAYDTLHPLGVVVSADVFGTIIDNESDAEIVGQNYQEMAACLDYICPMVYPSHYSNGVYGLEIPDKEPYETVYHAMTASKEKLDALTADVRVWLQDFTASWVKGHISYGADEVRAQIQAVYDAGYEEWILWNARMNYTEGALFPYWQEEDADEVTDADEDTDVD